MVRLLVRSSPFFGLMLSEGWQHWDLMLPVDRFFPNFLPHSIDFLSDLTKSKPKRFSEVSV